MSTLNITVDDTASPALRHLPSDLRAALQEVIENDVAALYARARQLAGGEALAVLTGKYLASIHDSVEVGDSKVTATVEIDDPRAGLFEYGGTTAPHVIEAASGGVLAFAGPDAATLFAAVVKHPGSLFARDGDIGRHATLLRATMEMKQKIVADIESAGDRLPREI